MITLTKQKERKNLHTVALPKPDSGGLVASHNTKVAHWHLSAHL
jgi:hypothetical protein